MAKSVLADLIFGGLAKITGLPAPSAASDAANKAYVDGLAGPPTQITLTVPANTIGYAEIVVADASVSAASKVTVEFVGEIDAENDLEGIADDNMRVFAVPESGQIRFVITALGAFVGPFKANYRVTA